MVQLVDRGEEGLGVHVFRLACVQDVLRLTFEVTGILWWAGFGLGFFSPNAARHKMSG